MGQNVEYREDLKTNVPLYVSVLCQEATSHAKYQVMDKTPTESRGLPSKSKSTNSATTPKATKDAPLCLKPDHAAKGLKHYLRDCSDCTEEEARKLLKEHRMKSKNIKKVGNRNDRDITESSVLFLATLADVTSQVLCADIGADINLMGDTFLNELVQKDAKVQISEFQSPKRYKPAANTDKNGNTMEIQCHRQANMNVHMHIRHGTALTL